MEWFHYVLLGLLPAIAAFGGGVLTKAVAVWREHREDSLLLEDLFKRLADKEDPLTPEEFRIKMQGLRVELGESKHAWKELWNEIKVLVQKMR